MIGSHYGKELILDLEECDPKLFTRDCIERFFILLCEKIDMKRHELFWWDDFGIPEEDRQTAAHLKGTSAVQFIMTSSIVIHTLDMMKTVHLNIFSCKDFSPETAVGFCAAFFSGKIKNFRVLDRG